MDKVQTKSQTEPKLRSYVFTSLNGKEVRFKTKRSIDNGTWAYFLPTMDAIKIDGVAELFYP